MPTNVNFTVNGEAHSVSDADLIALPLVDYLQEDLGLTGTKFCCGIGVCRACTVAVRRQPDAPMDVMLTCSTPLSQVNGLEIFTIESVAQDDQLHPLQRAMLTHYAFQCGYCTSGFLMAAMALWDRLVADPIPERDLDTAIQNAIGAHICRCTGYIRYHQAVRAAIVEQGGAGPMSITNRPWFFPALIAAVVLIALLVWFANRPQAPIETAETDGDAAEVEIDSAEDEEPAAPVADPTATPESIQTVLEYGQMCAEAIAEIPPFNCLDGMLIEITVNGGETPAEYKPMMDCDRPAFLPYHEAWSDGPCTPFTRALNLSNGTTQISAMCRQKVIRSADTNVFDEIDIIAHNAVDGSTCWFQAKGVDGEGLSGERVPPPNEATPPDGYPAAENFWHLPGEVARDGCGNCHDNDPFMYSPFVEEVWNELPTDPFGWYKHLGPDFAVWPQPLSIAPRGNACIGCHRIGATFTSAKGTREAVGLDPNPFLDEWASTYPASHWMPPGNFHSETQWNVIYEQSVNDLLACYEDHTLPFCVVEPITGLPSAE